MATVITLRRKSAKKKGNWQRWQKYKKIQKSRHLSAKKNQKTSVLKKTKKIAKNIDIFFQTHPAYQPKSKTKLKTKDSAELNLTKPLSKRVYQN